MPLYLVNPLLTLGLHFGMWLGLYINPDNDLHVRNKWLGFLGYNAYRDLISHRRGLRRKHWKDMKWWEWLTFSHLPYGGTLLRFLPLLILWLLLTYTWLTPYWIAFVALTVFNGMALSDTVHVIADILVSEVHKYD